MWVIKPENRLEAIDVLMLPDDQAVQWLRDHMPGDKSSWASDEEEHLHRLASFSFARRKSVRLQLAVAQYGSHVYTLKKLLAKGIKSQRLAVLSNALIGPVYEDLLFSDERVLSEAEALELLKRHQSDSREFTVFARNPHLNRSWLAEMVSSWTEKGQYDAESLFLVLNLANNPIILERRDETILCGYSEYTFDRLNLALVNLLQSAPVTRDWACVLAQLLEKLYLPYIPSFDVDLIERWKDPHPGDNAEGYWFLRLRSDIVQYLYHRFDRSKYPLSHCDPSVRRGIYRSCEPNELFAGLLYELNFQYPSFRDPDEDSLSQAERKLVEICKNCFELDKNVFVESLLENEAFWTRREHREFLKDIAWHLAEDPHFLMNAPNIYRGIEQYHRREHSEFFEDELYEDEVSGDACPEDPINESLVKIQQSLVELQNSVTSLSKNNIDQTQFRRLKSLVKDSHSKIEQLSNELSNDSAHLSNKIEVRCKEIQALLERKTGPLVWVLIIVILVISYLQIS